MDVNTAEAILAHHDGLRSWPQPFTFVTPDGDVDLTVAIGENARTPDNVSHYQPSVYPFWPRNKPVYRFDPWFYRGKKDKKLLFLTFAKVLLG